MWRVLLARMRQKHRTIGFPDDAPSLPDRFRGMPGLDPALCAENCKACADACPTGAVTAGPGELSLDVGRCLFCAECVSACPGGAIVHTNEYRMSARKREDLVLRASTKRPTSVPAPSASGRFQLPREVAERVRTLDTEMLRLFGRSLKLRQVSAGGCNACEADVNVLGTVVFDLGRFGIQYVASPRHADGLLITGTVPPNMRLALKKTYDAVPPPKIVIAVGACAISGGPYVGHGDNEGADAIVPVDLYIPGCPPHPITILDGLLTLLARINPDLTINKTK